ncbi:hypothetical protein [Aestuariibacter salexigens]|uniref:hypothetical protein n=1 Tax=Aestuariibacter salexigens TaxID=226010 RepID=UPI00040100E9|nr:hypothetical protein [Aestuariibacter salexigens]
MVVRIAALFLIGFVLSACSDAPDVNEPSQPENPQYTLQGQWIVDADGEVMLDPQTSGLIFWRNTLMSVSDGSAVEQQRLRLHQISPPAQGAQVAKLLPDSGPMRIASGVRRSCFGPYLRDEPDFEALVVDPDDDSVFILVTEDATRTGALTTRCQKRFQNTGSTDYPTLLVRVKRNREGVLTMTHVRPLQFAAEMEVGDFPNDGIEGMTFAINGSDKLSTSRTLYLGLEKDAHGQPRIFSVDIDADFWDSSDFVQVQAPELHTPVFEQGNHPINGLSAYYHAPTQVHYLVAAARNDNQLWFIDAAGVQPTIFVDLAFEAPTLSEQCPAFELMDNASLEGIAIDKQRIWLINDPWKRNYEKNIACASNEQRYKAMAPLLFWLDINPAWFATPHVKDVT